MRGFKGARHFKVSNGRNFVPIKKIFLLFPSALHLIWVITSQIIIEIMLLICYTDYAVFQQ